MSTNVKILQRWKLNISAQYNHQKDIHKSHRESENSSKPFFSHDTANLKDKNRKKESLLSKNCQAPKQNNFHAQITAKGLNTMHKLEREKRWTQHINV